MGAIFDNKAAVYTTAETDNQVVVHIGVSFSDKGIVLAGSAPATDISITRRVDCTINKSLSGDYQISTFGHHPVEITITGLDLYYAADSTGKLNQNSIIQKVYNDYNVHDNKDKYANVTITGATPDKKGDNDTISKGSTSPTTFKCRLLEMDNLLSTRGNQGAFGSYTLRFIGVQSK